jgi:hypothetical protein
VRANSFVPPPFVNDLRVIVSPGDIGFVKMMGRRKSSICNGKNGGLSTCQASRKHPRVPPFVSDLEMISPELGELVVFKENACGIYIKENTKEPIVHSLLSRQSHLQQNKLKAAIWQQHKTVSTHQLF